MSNPFQTPEASGLSTMPTRSVMKLKRVGVLSAGLFGAAAGFLLGLIGGVVVFFFALVGVGAGNAGAAEIGMALGMIVAYTIGGFLGTLIYAVIYNVVAGISGGIEVEFGTD